MRITAITLILVLITGSVGAQTREEPIDGAPSVSLRKAISPADSVLLSNLPTRTLPDEYRNKTLPDRIDNSVFPYLRPIFNQDGASCGQAASMGYHFTYEMDRKRMVPANLPENQYPTHFTWNFMNEVPGGFHPLDERL
jgi:hypothetical protein